MSGGEEAGKERPHRSDGDNGAAAAIPRWGGGWRGRRRPPAAGPKILTNGNCHRLWSRTIIQWKRSSVAFFFLENRICNENVKRK